jgi:hypothetical protein
MTETTENCFHKGAKSRVNACDHAVRIFYIPISYPKMQRLKYTELQFYMLLSMVQKLHSMGRS